MIANVRTHSSVPGRRQFSQTPARENGSRLFMPTAYGCFGSPGLKAFHSKKLSIGTRHRLVKVGFPEAGKLRNRFRLRVDGPSAAVLVFTPVGNQTPPEPVKGSLTCLRLLANDPVLLARRNVIPRPRWRWLDKI